MTIRTRFAPSPTGYLHIGGARTALFSWVFARKNQGQFVLRIEDTDLERSSQESVQAILDGMKWLNLDHDEGPFYQMQRMDRYREMIQKLLDEDKAYYCYASPEELETMREQQRAKGEKPRYDGRWRPEEGKTLPTPPQDVKPVIRFKNPQQGKVSWQDQVKGEISFDNQELDDLIIARPDGTPTYNFCVVIDDWDMQITHVIRGDDHVNNTPRQINILNALGADIPLYAHVPMILGSDGQRMSKRHGAVSVMQYAEQGYLPEALINYLARLGWSHGDAEIFSIDELINWFDLTQINKSAAQFNQEKLNWLNQHYLKEIDLTRLTTLLKPYLAERNIQISEQPALADLAALYRDRVTTLVELVEEISIFYQDVTPPSELLQQQLTDDIKPILREFTTQLETVDWSIDAISALIKTTLKQHSLKMPKVAMPLRIILAGKKNTPSVDALIYHFPRETVIQRLMQQLS